MLAEIVITAMGRVTWDTSKISSIAKFVDQEVGSASATSTGPVTKKILLTLKSTN
jgi:hypothetical protein